MKEVMSSLISAIAFPFAIVFVIWDRAVGLAEIIISMMEEDRRV